ncbi:MAG: tRNA threonylcarbamoyladenosine dehydratase [Clostridia bacterium]|nr:tRNA threonylcarbamoyladenosine dehydratase [Clostridia bacterium]
MIGETFSRTERLLGEAAMKRLSASRVAVFGIGGVGGYVAEALARSGVGALDLFDNDTVSESNLNRQIIALRSTVGQYKVDVMRDRIADICPDTKVIPHRCFYMPEIAAEYPFDGYDFVVDAVDTVAAKLTIIEQANRAGVPVISCMGTGNKVDPSRLVLTDISKTSVCPLARVMRKELRDRGISHVTVVYSTESPRVSERPPASIMYVPASAGLLIASHVVNTLTEKTD